MEKTALIQEFRTRVGEDDAKVISDKTFDGIADTVLPLFADDTQVTDETWKMPIAMLKQYAGQKRHDEAEFTRKFKTDYAAEHEKDVNARIEAAKQAALEEYRKKHPEKKEDGGNGDADDIDKKIEEKMKALMGSDSEFGKLSKSFSDFLESQKNREKTENKNRVRAELISYLTGLEKEARKGDAIPTEITNLIEDAATYIDYGDDPKTESLKATVKARYENEYKRRYPNGGQPFGGSGSGAGGGGGDDFVKERLEQLKKEVKDSADYAAEQEKTFV